ncbi:MAG: hypothetical protein HQ582_31530 [Planctomycetes bacterium]|nr:hypothetical protein [Planctomycetota bacterium]
MDWLKKWLRTRRIAKLEKLLADTQTRVQVLEQAARIKDAEIQEMAAVIARNLERVKAESATLARQRAAMEGGK